MNHAELKEKMMAFEDGELSASEKAELETHLAACEDCRGALESWRDAKRAFLSPSRPSRAETELFVRTVMARVEEPAWDWRRALAPAFGLAFAAAAVALAYPRTPADPVEALLERDTGVYFFLSQPAPATPDDVLSFATEGR